VTSYTILAEKDVTLDDNNDVYDGSVGAPASNGKISIDKNGSVASPGTFVQAKTISVTNPANVPIRYTTPATATMPTVLLNTTSPSGSNLTVTSTTTSPVTGNFKDVTVNNNVTVTLDGTVFRNIRIKGGATVTFSASTVYVNNLDMDDNSSLAFSSNATSIEVRASGNITIGKSCTVNGAGKGLTLHLADPAGISARSFDIADNGTSLTANIIMPKGKLFAKGGSGVTTMKGRFTAERVQGGLNVQWYGSNCGSSTARLTMAQAGQAPEAASAAGIKVYPNPTTGEFTVEFEDVAKAAVVRVLDIQGRVIEQRSLTLSQMPATRFNLNEQSAGVYLIEVMQEGQQKWTRLVKR
jgi:hypothetical protein